MFFRQPASAFLRRIRLPSQAVTGACRATSNRLSASAPLHSRKKCSFLYSEVSNWTSQHGDILWIFLSGQAALIFGISCCPVFAENIATEVTSENDPGASNVAGLQRVDDGSVVSNEHTSKWRIFTDNGREFFMQGKLDEAEKLFLLAVEEAKEGFGEQDPHVASACNNLAELYRVRRAYDTAEPLYLKAIKILEDSYGPEDVRVGAAFHNMGKFYLMQHRLEQARVSYERALKIKGRVLGHGHSDYADTMYHLGIMFLKSNRLEEAEHVQRKILHKMDLSKGWNSLDTVIAAESLAMTLQSLGKLMDARELLERCLDARRSLLPADHIQISANMFSLGRLLMLNSNQLRKLGTSEAVAELDRAKDLLSDTIRITQRVLDGMSGHKHNMHNYGPHEDSRRDGDTALLILLQSLNALARLEIAKQDYQESGFDHDSGGVGSTMLGLFFAFAGKRFKNLKPGGVMIGGLGLQCSFLEKTNQQDEMCDVFLLVVLWMLSRLGVNWLSWADAVEEDAKDLSWLEEASVFATESALHKCISAYREYGNKKSISASVEVKAEYLSCLKCLLNLIHDTMTKKAGPVGRATTQELKDEIKHVEAEISQSRKQRI
ncbi:hypothetical protein Ancab_034190 [Ancistrocladus abbreviatus]